MTKYIYHKTTGEIVGVHSETGIVLGKLVKRPANLIPKKDVENVYGSSGAVIGVMTEAGIILGDSYTDIKHTQLDHGLPPSGIIVDGEVYFPVYQL